jgi:hypothetical protein
MFSLCQVLEMKAIGLNTLGFTDAEAQRMQRMGDCRKNKFFSQKALGK